MLTQLLSVAMNDFYYVTNLQNFTWTPQFATLILPNANGATCARMGHSGGVKCLCLSVFSSTYSNFSCA